MRSAETGIRAHAAAFALLVAVNVFVGATVGIERSTLPLLAEFEFGLASAAAALSFIVTFGLTKALVNLFAGALADRYGRRRVLLAGWLLGVPVPILVILAPSWSWIVLANALLGVNQGLAWSMTVNMKLDLATSRERGLAVGWNETAGYLGLALGAAVAGLLAGAFGPRVAPYLAGVAFAAAGLALSLLVRETRAPRPTPPRRRLVRALAEGSWRSRRLASASLAGLATNLKDGVLWGALPLLLAAKGRSLGEIGLVAAAYPLAWGVAQLATGALSDRVGRRALILPGLALQAAAVLGIAIAPTFGLSLLAAAAAGLGTALCYPTLLAYVGDHAPPDDRATSLGVYRMWRDAGYAAGALLAGILADAAGLGAAFAAAAILVLLAAVAFAALSRPPRTEVPSAASDAA